MKKIAFTHIDSESKKQYIKPDMQVYDIKASKILCASPDPYGSPDPNNPYDFD